MLGSSRAVFLSHADRRLITTALLLIYALANAASCAASELSADPADTADQQVVNPSVANMNATTESTSFSPLFAPVSRVYIAPIIGPSWATLSRSVEGEKLSSSNGNLFTAGGAFGFTIPFEKSQCRIEIEPRYRDSFTVLKNNELGASSFRTGDNWSVLTNAWCDFGVTDRLGLYAGGGLGSGGYSVNLAGVTHDGDALLVGNGKVAAFAWQVGGGRSLCPE